MTSQRKLMICCSIVIDRFIVIVRRGCRCDNLNMWFECAFEGAASAGVTLVGGGGDWGGATMVVSSRFTNVGRPASSGTDLPVINSRIEVGPQSEWALPSGGRTFVEGCNVTALAGANESATLLQPGDGETLTLMNNNLANLPLGAALFPRGPTHPTHWPQPGAIWELINNRFLNPAEAHWNVLAVRLQGTDSGPSTQVLSAKPSDGAPVSGLLYTPAGA